MNEFEEIGESNEQTKSSAIEELVSETVRQRLDSTFDNLFKVQAPHHYTPIYPAYHRQRHPAANNSTLIKFSSVIRKLKQSTGKWQLIKVNRTNYISNALPVELKIKSVLDASDEFVRDCYLALILYNLESGDAVAETSVGAMNLYTEDIIQDSEEVRLKKILQNDEYAHSIISNNKL